MEKSDVGKRIQSFREKQEITREELAERTGMTVPFIVAVEEEGHYPSLGPLLKIARSLGVRLGTFLDDKVSEDPLIVRLDERSEALTTHHEGEEQPALHFHSLGSGKSDRHMEPFFIEILPESSKNKKLSSHEGEEFIIVHEGEITVDHGKDVHVLKKGDSVYFNSIVPHCVYTTEAPAEIYAVLYFPE